MYIYIYIHTYIYTVDDYSAINRNEILPFSTKWMNLVGTVLVK